MAENLLEGLHLSLMQDALPVGLAIVDRIKKEGFTGAFSVFQASSKPLEELQKEGQISAEAFRNKLDSIFPGLGNPVMSVKVTVSEKSIDKKEFDDLMLVLRDIEDRLELLNNFFSEKNEISTK